MQVVKPRFHAGTRLFLLKGADVTDIPRDEYSYYYHTLASKFLRIFLRTERQITETLNQCLDWSHSVLTDRKKSAMNWIFLFWHAGQNIVLAGTEGGQIWG